MANGTMSAGGCVSDIIVSGTTEANGNFNTGIDMNSYVIVNIFPIRNELGYRTSWYTIACGCNPSGDILVVTCMNGSSPVASEAVKIRVEVMPR